MGDKKESVKVTQEMVLGASSKKDQKLLLSVEE